MSASEPVISEQRIDAPYVRSLVWSGDELVDWVDGGKRYQLGGEVIDPCVRYAFGFDAAVATTDGEWAVLYKRRGTKALVLCEGELIRELDRSFYHADDYEYPVCIWRHTSGRVLVAHCPERYCQLDIDDAETGERLTSIEGARDSDDFFHSRLQPSPSGTRVLSAGWVWHPLDAVAFYEVDPALEDGRYLDSLQGKTPSYESGLYISEEGSPCWRGDDQLILGSTSEEELDADDENDDGLQLLPRGLLVYDLGEQRAVAAVAMPEPPGRMMPVGDRFVLAFYGHPKLIDLEAGAITRSWPELSTGYGGQQSSIMRSDMDIPPLALDPANRRFALALGKEIVVVTIDAR